MMHVWHCRFVTKQPNTQQTHTDPNQRKTWANRHNMWTVYETDKNTKSLNMLFPQTAVLLSQYWLGHADYSRCIIIYKTVFHGTHK